MINDSEKTPDWAKKSIGYICFVDSFASNGLLPNELYTGQVYGQNMVKLEWHENDPTLHHSSGFYGGNLRGIQYATNYFQYLGITFLYLSPVFEAHSNHKYDTINYLKIDRHFGTDDDFKNLVESCHNNGIKIILDGVFNHTSSEHEWYKKAKSGDEKYRNYYKINKDGYIIVWNGIDTLPVLNHSNPEIQDYFYKSNNSVIKYWLKVGIDGWRLDVAERLGKDVLNALRKSIKDFSPDKLLIGEVVETYGKEWLEPGLLDGVMNYVFKGVTTNFLTNRIDGNNYLHELSKMYDEYPNDKLLVSWNIISTHDTNRMLYDVNNNESLFKIAGILQFTYPGVPVIYYGDELGTSTGEKEFNNRLGMEWETVKSYERYRQNQPMHWEKINKYNSYHQFFKHLIWLRKNFSVLSEGGFIPIYSSENVIAYIRNSDTKYAFIIVNRGENQTVKLEIPDFITTKSPTLRCYYGGNTPFHLNQKNIDFYIGGENAYVFMN